MHCTSISPTAAWRSSIRCEEATRDTDLIIVAVGTPARDDGSADLSALYIAVEELGKTEVHHLADRRHPLDGAARHERSAGEIGRGLGRARVRAGISARRLGRLRLPAPRSHRRRVRLGRGRRALREAVRIAAEAGAVHLAQQCRADQVRIERVPRAQDQLRQRDREPVRCARRDLRRRAARHRLRPPHRLAVPQPRHRLRRPVLREGRQEHRARRHQAQHGARALLGHVTRQRSAAIAHRGSGRR